jgi:hypothetical protein
MLHFCGQGSSKARDNKSIYADVCKEALAYEEMVHYTAGRVFVSGWGYWLFIIWSMKKKKPLFKMPAWKVVPDNFFVGPTGFYREWQINLGTYLIENSLRKLAAFVVTVATNLFKRIRDSLRYRMTKIVTI